MAVRCIGLTTCYATPLLQNWFPLPAIHVLTCHDYARHGHSVHVPTLKLNAVIIRMANLFALGPHHPPVCSIECVFRPWLASNLITKPSPKDRLGTSATVAVPAGIPPPSFPIITLGFQYFGDGNHCEALVPVDKVDGERFFNYAGVQDVLGLDFGRGVFQQSVKAKHLVYGERRLLLAEDVGSLEQGITAFHMLVVEFPLALESQVLQVEGQLKLGWLQLDYCPVYHLAK